VNDLILKQNTLKEAIKEAEEKCIPLCANCHRILHFEERRVIRVRRKKKA
jgi:predicted HNH restriction endonuclease